MTAIEATQDEAQKQGITLTIDAADDLLWNETGFPCFWSDPGETQEDTIRKAVRKALKARGADSA